MAAIQNNYYTDTAKVTNVNANPFSKDVKTDDLSDIDELRMQDIITIAPENKERKELDKILDGIRSKKSGAKIISKDIPILAPSKNPSDLSVNDKLKLEDKIINFSASSPLLVHGLSSNIDTSEIVNNIKVGVQTLTNIAIAYAPVLALLFNSIKNYIETNKALSDILNKLIQFCAEINRIVEEFTKKAYSAMVSSITSTTRWSGFATVIMGNIEFAAGFCLFRFTSYKALGAELMVNAPFKIAAGWYAVIFPESASKSKLCDNFMQNGIFGIFGSYGNTVQSVLGVLLGLGGAMASYGNSLVNGLRSGLKNFVYSTFRAGGGRAVFKMALAALNLGMIVVGSILNLIKIAVDLYENKDDSKPGDRVFWQALSMGIISLAVYGIIQVTGLMDFLKEKLGEHGAAALEGFMSLAANLYFNHKLGKHLTFPETHNPIVPDAKMIKMQSVMTSLMAMLAVNAITAAVNNIFQIVNTNIMNSYSNHMHIRETQTNRANDINNIRNQIHQNTANQINDNISGDTKKVGEVTMTLLNVIRGEASLYRQSAY